MCAGGVRRHSLMVLDEKISIRNVYTIRGENVNKLSSVVGHVFLCWYCVVLDSPGHSDLLSHVIYYLYPVQSSGEPYSMYV